MKRIVTLLAIVGLCHLNTFSQKKYEMVVEKTDGTETVFNVEDIVRTFFRERTAGTGDCPDNNHPHWIDLGLPSGTLWRCCNEGASTPEGFGGYYTFGQVPSAPSLDQIKELLGYTIWVWTTQNGINGMKFTGRNGNGGTIFLPAAGQRWDGESGLVGWGGFYRSSTPNGENDAYILGFDSDGMRWYGSDRGFERSVRPVR